MHTKTVKREVNMLSGSIMKGLFSIAIPIMIMNVTMSLFNIVDMTVLRMFDSSGGFAVGAVGACSNLINLITGLMIGCSAGANVVIAKYIGMGDRERIEKATGASILFALVGGIVLSVVGVCCAEVFLGWMNCPDELIKDAALYFRLYFVGLPIFMVYNFSASILRSAGDSKRPMMYLITGSTIKLGFNLLFVAGLKMTVDGVAYATLISWIFMTVLGISALLKNQGIIKLKPSRIRFYTKELKEILIIGVPTGLQQALYSIANVIIAATVNSFGAEATTGISIANSFDGILYQIVTAPALAVMPYVSQNIGHKNIKRVRHIIVNGLIINVCLGATFGCLSALFSAQLSSLMSANPAVIAYSQQKMIIISSTYFICGINDIFGATLRGMGKPNIPTIATLFYMCLFRFVWVYLIFPLVPNLTFLYLVWPIGWILSIATLIPFCLKGLKKMEREQTSHLT